jgi:hypothetical protein
MCPPYLRAHTQVRPYKTLLRYIWDMKLSRRLGIECLEIFFSFG